jgi:hypothetical protein
MVTLKPGTKLRSTTCTTEVVVVKGAGDVDVCCGGSPMVPAADADDPTAAPRPPFDGGTLLGKRYATDDVELLCTKAGPGSLSVGDEPIGLKEAKPLPASD